MGESHEEGWEETVTGLIRHGEEWIWNIGRKEAELLFVSFFFLIFGGLGWRELLGWLFGEFVSK